MFRVGLGLLDILMIQEYICGIYCHIDLKDVYKAKYLYVEFLNYCSQ